MAISVAWATGVITVPKADTDLVQSSPYEIRSLDTNWFRGELRKLEDDEAGRPWPRTHNHNEDITIEGVTYVDALLILPPYTVTFEDGQYGVTLIGTNNNIRERRNPNQVSVAPTNSAGLQVVTSGSVVTEQDKLDIADRVWDEILSGATHNVPSSSGRRLRQLGDVVNGNITDAGATTLIFDTDVTPSYDGFYNDQYIRFITGNLTGIVRIITDHTIAGQITVSEDLPVAPANGDEFEIIPVHIHPKEQVADAVWNKTLP